MIEGTPPEEYIEFMKLFDPIIIPTAKVTTKPRACNYGLLRAKGNYASFMMLKTTLTLIS